MADTTYAPKIYMPGGPAGGDQLVVASGGVINVETGGVIQANGTQASAITALTDSTTGTGDNTVVDVGAAFNQATLNNNFADLIAKINALIAAVKGAGITA